MRTGRAPSRVTPAIREFVARLVPGGRGLFVDVEPRLDARPTYCTESVLAQVAERGGWMVCGWRIYEWPTVWLEAEFHAVWETPTGELRCVSLSVGDKPIFFVPDPDMVYEGRQRENQFYRLRELKEIDRVIRTRQAEFTIMNANSPCYSGSGKKFKRCCRRGG